MTAATVESLGLAVTVGSDAGLELVGAAGRGRLAPLARGWQLRFAPALSEDPVEQARRAAELAAPLRLVRRNGLAAIEGVGLRDRLIAGLVAFLDLRPPAVPPAVRDLVVGVLAVTVPPVDAPAFFRLARAGAKPVAVDQARAVFALVANAELRIGRAAWIDGPGLLVEPAASADPDLAREIRVVHDGLGALADSAIAASYLERSPPAGGRPGSPTPHREEEAP